MTFKFTHPTVASLNKHLEDLYLFCQSGVVIKFVF